MALQQHLTSFPSIKIRVSCQGLDQQRVKTFACMAYVDIRRVAGAPWQSHSLYSYSIPLISLSMLTPIPPCIEYYSSRRNLKVR